MEISGYGQIAAFGVAVDYDTKNGFTVTPFSGWSLGFSSTQSRSFSQKVGDARFGEFRVMVDGIAQTLVAPAARRSFFIDPRARKISQFAHSV